MYMHNEDLHIETSSTGARICTLQKGSKHFFYPQQIINKESGIVMRGGMHICSPIFGSPEGKGIFSSAPQHGELRNVFWDHNYFDDRERNFSYEYRHWGMSIDYDVSYLISGNRLDIDTEIFNCEKFPVPIEFGWHPYFNAPDGGEVKFVDNDISDIVIQQTYGSKVFPATDTILIKLNGIGTVRMELTEGFNKGNVCVWTDWRQKYFCVEPLLSYHNFDTENGVYLQPKQTFTANFAMHFED